MPTTRTLTQATGVALVAAVVAFLPFGMAHAADKGKEVKPAMDMKAAMEKNGCFACHGIGAKEPKKMGPNYGAVAAKYAKDKKATDKLAAKIRAGGSGSFGAIPMPPQAQVSAADAKEMAAWILKQK